MELEEKTQKHTVLIVDNFEAVVEIASHCLAQEGYFVLSAPSGEEALRVAAGYDGAIDIVLAEEKLPGIDGIALVTQLRSMRPDIAIIVMSGTVKGKTYQKHEAELGAKFLWKPFTSSELLGAVKTMVPAASATRAARNID